MDDETLSEMRTVPLEAWRGLSDPEGCSGDEWWSAAEHGLLHTDGSVEDPVICPTRKGERYLSALDGVACGLSDEQIRHIRGDGPLFSAVVDGMEARGLLRVLVVSGIYVTEPTDLGKAVILRRERNG